MLDYVFSTGYDRVPLDLARMLSEIPGTLRSRDMAGFLTKLIMMQKYTTDNTRNYKGKVWVYVYNSQVRDYLIDASASTAKRFIAALEDTGYIERIVWPKFPHKAFRIEGRGLKQPSWYAVANDKIKEDLTKYRESNNISESLSRKEVTDNNKAQTVDTYNYIVTSLRDMSSSQLDMIENLASVLLCDSCTGLHSHMLEIPRTDTGVRNLMSIDRGVAHSPERTVLRLAMYILALLKKDNEAYGLSVKYVKGRDAKYLAADLYMCVLLSIYLSYLGDTQTYIPYTSTEIGSVENTFVYTGKRNETQLLKVLSVLAPKGMIDSGLMYEYLVHAYVGKLSLTSLATGNWIQGYIEYASS